MKRLNIKGFTLIELLAVIVILAALLAIAVPRVTQYITKSRSDGMVSNAKEFADAVRKDASFGEYEFPAGPGDVTIVSLDLIKLDKGGTKSPFGGEWVPGYSYVAIINVGTDEDPNYKYYFASLDSRRYTVPLTLDSEMERSIIVRPRDMTSAEKLITRICSNTEPTVEDSSRTYSDILGLEKPTGVTSWSASIYSSVKCGG